MAKRASENLYIRSPKRNLLSILNALSSNPNLTQASLAERCDLSVAMVNNYLKELDSAGVIEYRRKSLRVISYHLTQAGKRKLTEVQQDLLGEMIGFYSETKSWLLNSIVEQAGSLQRVLLFGTGELCELALHALESEGIKVMGICDEAPDRIGQEWCGREILNPAQIRYIAPDAVVIVDVGRTDEIYANQQHLLSSGIALVRLDGNPSEAPASTQEEEPSMSLV